MTKRRILAGVAVACLLCAAGLRAQSAPAADSSSEASVVPRVIKYSGAINPRIVQSTESESAKNASPTVVSLTFSLYELQEGGGPLWSETQKVQMDQNGRYTVILGATVGEGLPLDLFTSGKALWLGVQPELPGAAEQPRVLLVAVPYALKASDADTLGGKPASAYALAGSAVGVVTGSSTSAPPATGVATSPAVMTNPQATLQSGDASAPNNNSGVNNTATGYGALASNTTGSDNTADGYGALFTNSTGYFNTGVGEAALTLNTTGYWNTASGGAALFFNTTGNSNTATGAGALQDTTTGSNNNAAGAEALLNNTTGSNNTADGSNAGINLKNGSANIFLGYLAGQNLKSSESNNIDIGNQAVTGESGVIRVGTAGTQTATYIAGISGVAPSGTPLPVVINSSGQLGTGASAVGTITGVTAGAGLSGGGTSGNVTLSVPSAGVTDAMLANGYSGVGTCTTGKVVSGLARDAAPTCVTAGNGTVTSVATGAGLTGGPITSSGTVSIASGGVTNSMLQNSSLTVSTGSGLSGGGSVALGGTLSLNNTGVLSVGTTAGSGILVGGTAANPSLSADPTVLATNSSVTSAVSGGVTTAETFASGAASTAQGNAETFATGAANTAQANAEAYANGLTFLPLAGGALTGGLSGTSASFSNAVTAAGAILPATGTATAGAGFNSNPLDSHASSYSNSTSQAIDQLFRWQAEPLGNDTSSPSGTLNLLFGANGATPSETGLSVAGNGVITFASGQTFPGAGTGTITGVAAGSGLSGGGTSGNVSLSIPAGGVTNGLLANASVTVTAGTGLSGGGPVALGGSTTLSLASNSCANGYALQGLPASCTPLAFLPLAGGTLTGNLGGTTASLSGTLTVATVKSTNPYQIGGMNVLTVDTGNTHYPTGDADVFVGSPEPASLTGYEDTATGYQALYSVTSGYRNTASGAYALRDNTSGSFNTASGDIALYSNTTGSYNTASGWNALNINRTGNYNTAYGYQAGVYLGNSNSQGGSSNIMLGNYAGGNFNANESNNIDIANAGVTGESNVIRIGDTLAQDNCALPCQTATFIAGINGVNLGANSVPVVINANGQLGTGTSAVGTITGVTAGTGLSGGGASGNVTLNVNESVIATQTYANGAASSAASTAQSNAEGYANSTFLNLTGGTLSGGLTGTTASFSGTVNASAYQIGGTNVLGVDSNNNNVFVGSPEPATPGFHNTAVGQYALEVDTSDVSGSGDDNTATGYSALINNTMGYDNTASGYSALGNNITGYQNTAIGKGAGENLGRKSLAGGYSNIMVGYHAGLNFDGGLGDESNNIDIGNLGVEGESGVIRIGTAGTQTSAYIAGINGATGLSSPVGVVIDPVTGQLGTVQSSRRYKEDIHDMGAASDGLLRLRPVTFRYKKPDGDGSKPIQYGLIAEEVADVYPDLVVRNKDGQIETVQYYKLDAMLLNEVQKLSKAHAADQTEIARLQSQVAEQAKQGQEQQAAMTQLLAQVHGIQLSLASGRPAHTGRPHSRVTRSAARHANARATKVATKPEVKQPSGQPLLSLVAKVRF